MRLIKVSTVTEDTDECPDTEGQHRRFRYRSRVSRRDSKSLRIGRRLPMKINLKISYGVLIIQVPF